MNPKNPTQPKWLISHCYRRAHRRQPEKVEEPVELTWGEERQLSLKANEWEKLIFTSFTGVRTELGPTSVRGLVQQEKRFSA